MNASLITLALLIVTTPVALAQDVSPSPSPSPVATASPAHRMASFTLPKGWHQAPGDSVAMEWDSPDGMQSLRVAKTGVDPAYTVDKGLAKVKSMIAEFGFPNALVAPTMVCSGTQPAISAISKNDKGVILLDMVVVQGNLGGALVTYGNPAGADPDPAALYALSSVCWP